jgi:hypothetical protein
VFASEQEERRASSRKTPEKLTKSPVFTGINKTSEKVSGCGTSFAICCREYRRNNLSYFLFLKTVKRLIMKAVNTGTIKLRNLATTLLVVFAFLMNVIPVLAHGGEDHGDEKPKVVSAGKGTIARTARAGDFEVTIKHSPIEPDTETAARLFVTRFETNEPFADAKPTIEITTKDGKTFEASEIKADAPGSYSFKLPPLPEGTYTILTRLSAPGGKTDTATFSSVAVEHPVAELVVDTAWAWLKTALMILAALVVLGLLGGLVFYAARYAKQDRADVSGEEAVSA